MFKPGKTEWTIDRPGSDFQSLFDFANELRVLDPISIDIDPESQSIFPNFPIGKTKPHINVHDCDCLEGAAVFSSSSKPPGSSAAQSDLKMEGDVFIRDLTDGCVSRIKNVVYKGDGAGKWSLHHPSYDGRMMFGGDFAGGTQVESTKTPGLFYLNGAKYTARHYWNPDHSGDQASLDTPTTFTNMSGSLKSGRSPPAKTAASGVAGRLKSKRPRKKRQSPPAGSSGLATGTPRDSLGGTNKLVTHYRPLRPYVPESMDDQEASDQDAASQSKQASMHADIRSRLPPTNTDTTQQGGQSGYHSHNQAIPLQSVVEEEEKGAEMFKYRMQKFYDEQSQD